MVHANHLLQLHRHASFKPSESHHHGHITSARDAAKPLRAFDMQVFVPMNTIINMVYNPQVGFMLLHQKCCGWLEDTSFHLLFTLYKHPLGPQNIMDVF